jgi:segregation and condensation protein A
MALPGSSAPGSSTPAGSPASLPSVQWEQFDGPLDLLLEEVRRQNVAIEKISMAPIVARFLEYVRTAAERNLNLDIEWLHMAATLIHWKSRSLLPSDAGGQAQPDGIRDDLVRRLLAHKREAAEELGRRRSAEGTRFSRTTDPEFREEAATEEAGESGFVSVWDMMQQAREIGRWVREHREGRRHLGETFGVEQDEVTVPEMIGYLRTQLAAAAGLKLDGLRLLEEQPSASHRCCLFLGMLEMACDRQLEMEQNEGFGPISLADRVTAEPPRRIDSHQS